MEVRTDLDVTGASIQVQMQVLDLPIVSKLVLNVVLGGFFMHVRNENYPSFYRYSSKSDGSS